MAACTNNGGSRARRAVTAALVGVLSVGTVPMVALAAPAADNVQVMTADDQKAFANVSIITAAYSQQFDRESSLSNLTAIADGNPITVTPQAIVTGNNKTVSLTATDADKTYSVSYVKADEKGEPTDEVVPEVTLPGKYCVKVTAIDGIYEGASVYLPFTVKAASLGTLSAYEVVDGNAMDNGDTTFTYTGSELNVGIAQQASDGSYVPLAEGKDYEVKFLPANSDIDDAGVTVKNKGTYYAVVTGLGIYARQSATIKSFQVNEFGLGGQAVEITVDPVVASNEYPEHPTTVKWTNNGYVTYLDPSLVKLELTNGGDGVFGAAGTYTFKAVPANSDGNVTGEKSGVTVEKYERAVTFQYNKGAWPESLSHDLSDKESEAFDIYNVKALDGDKSVDFTAVVTDESGAVVCTYTNNFSSEGNQDWAYKAGNYTIKVTAGASDHSAGGSATISYTVTNGTIDADATAYVNYEGKAVTSITAEYDGNDLLGEIEVIVKNADGKELDKDTDYVVVVKDAEGNVVDEIVDAGSYTVEIVGKTYVLTGTATVPVTVEPKAYEGLTSGALVSTQFNALGADYEYLPWDKDGVTAKGLDLVYGDSEIAFDYNNYTVTILKDGVEVSKITDEGNYTVHFEPVNDEVAKNYQTPADLAILCVKADHTKFVDVRWTDHFADAVAWVSDVNRAYMTGYGNTNVFGGWDNITRADVVGVLYKMAGGDSLTVSGSLYDTHVGWKSFDDVDGKQCYGRALAWAKSVGIANGHDGNFRPMETVTREEFAAFLANYAELFDPSYVAADASALDKVSDGSAVSGWAVGSVAWAVESGIMGNAGSVNPSDTIIRGDVAGMIYNYAK